MDSVSDEREELTMPAFRRRGMARRNRILAVVAGLVAAHCLIAGFFIHREELRRRQQMVGARATALSRAMAAAVQTVQSTSHLQGMLVAAKSESGAESITAALGDPPLCVASTRADWLDKPLSALPGIDTSNAALRRAIRSDQPTIIPLPGDYDHRAAADTIACSVPLQMPNLNGAEAPNTGVLLLEFNPHQFSGDENSGVMKLVLGLSGLTLVAVCSGFYLVRRMVFSRFTPLVHAVQSVISERPELSGSPARSDGLGQLEATLGEVLNELIVREDAEQAAAEFALREMREKTAALQTLTNYKKALDEHACVIVTDCEGIITQVNDKFCQVTQFSRDELVGKTHEILDAQHHPPGFWQELWKCVREGNVWDGEICNRTKDGSVVWSRTTIVPCKDENDEISQFISIRPDITRLKLAEESLRETKEQFELAVQGSSDGIWDWNLINGEIYLSSRFQELLGYADGEIPAQATAVRRCIHPEDALEAFKTLREYLECGGYFEVNVRMRTKTGHWRWYRARGKAVRDGSGKARRMAGSLSDIHELKCAQEGFQQAALYDKLTGLPNRSLLLDRTRQILLRAHRNNQHNYAVMFLDFDRFKFVNDSFGHDVGDLMLQEIASRLSSELRAQDSVSRLKSESTAARQGGDEFVILLEGLADIVDAALVADRLLASLAKPFELGAHEVHSSASIGIVLGSPDYHSADDLLRDADTAMYEAKRMGKGRFVVFDARMREKVQRRVRLENDLRRALTRDELFLEYQPIVSLKNGAVFCLEGLIRWQHPTEGLIGPTDFVPVAEDSDLIFQLGQWVLSTGCRDLALWRQSLGDGAPAILSLNLSRKQFNEPALVDVIRQTVTDAGVPPESIQLEITEDAFTSDPDSAISKMHALKRIGVRLAIDDFGVGHSSYGALQKFPVDALKIDRSLTADVSDSRDTAALIHSVAVLVKNLGIELVVEGVENEKQLIALSELGCEFAQGFFFGKPMPFAAVQEFLKNQNRADLCVAGAMSFARRWKERLLVFQESIAD